MNKIVKAGKWYFLAMAAASGGPLLAGAMMGLVPAVLALFVLLLIVPHQPERILDVVLGWGAFGAALGAVNEVVCRLFVSYNPGPGAFFAYQILASGEGIEVVGGPARGKRLAAAFGKLWFRKRQEEVEIRWFGLPLTGSRREIKMNLGPFPGLLRVTFGGDFDLKEIYGKIVRWGDHEGFDEWLRSRVLEVSEESAVQQVLRQIDSRRAPESLLLELKAPLRIALKDAGFPKVLGNIEGIEFTLYYTCTSVMTFNMA